MKKILVIVLAAVVVVGIGLTCFFVVKGQNSGACKDGHTYSAEWSGDEEYHWHAATCEHTNEVKDKAKHSFGEIVTDRAATPAEKGLGHKTCPVCDRTIYNIEIDYNDVAYDPDADVTLLFDVRGGKKIQPVTVKAGTIINLNAYTVTGTGGAGIDFVGWTIGGQKVESFVIKADTVVHAAYSCDDDYFGHQTVQFGRYPQTVETDADVIAALEKMDISDKNANGYYEYNGNEYAKEICSFDTNKLSFERGKAYYFKVEPISWVYKNGRYTTLRVIDFVDDYGLIEYLNGDFYNSLTDAEKALIADTKVNKVNETTYKFYLWNVEQYANSHADESDRKQSLTDYALLRDTTETYKDDRFTTKIWLTDTVGENAYLYDFSTASGSLKWEHNAAYSGNCGLMPCFNFDFKGIEKQTSDKAIRVTFDTNGGNEMPSVALIAGEKYLIAAENVPVKEGFDFVGWSTVKDGDNTRDVYDKTEYFESDKNVTLYARWEEQAAKSYSITYELNGGAFSASDKVKNQYSSDDVVTFVKPEKKSTISYNYTFDGWYLEADFKTKVSSTDGLNGDITVYAKWLEQGIYFTINYDTNGGTMTTPATVKVLCAEGKMDLPVPEKDGYVFIGWKTTWQNDLITSLDTNRTGSVSLTAWYTPSHDIVWDLKGGTLANQSELPAAIYSDCPTIDFTKFVPEKQGYKFLYWDLSWKSGKFGTSDNPTLSFKNGSNLPSSSGSVTITAVFAEVYSLTVNAMGGNFDGKSEIVVEFNKVKGTLSFKNPVKDGVNLIGWSTNPDCSSEATYSNTYGTQKYFTIDGDSTTFEQSTMFGYNSDLVMVQQIEKIYAIWDKVKISFVPGIDGVTKDDVYVDYNTYVDFTSADYLLDNTDEKKFDAWYYDEDFSVKCGSSARFTADCAVYARWNGKLKITLVYENGDISEQYIFEGETIASLKYDTGENEYVKNVYLDAEHTQKLTYSQLKSYIPKADITLYVVKGKL